jgi:predicted nucleic acid-binding protein
MGWVNSLQGHKVGLDTMPIIYFTEENPVYFKVIEPFFEAIGRGEITVVTSIVTLLEVLVHPNRDGNPELAQRYRDLLFKTKGLKTILLDQDIAEQAARLRAVHNIRTPDSIQMATSINKEASFFLTNDKHLPSLPNLTTLVLDDLKKEA